MTHAFFLSIMSMLGIPATLAGGLVTVIVLNNRARSRREKTESKGGAGHDDSAAPPTDVGAAPTDQAPHDS